MSFKGDAARQMLCALMSNDRLLQEQHNEKLAPEMKAAVMGELLRRDLIAGNYQI